MKKVLILGSGRVTSEYKALMTKAVSLGYTVPSLKQQAIQNQLIIDMKHAGIWGKLDSFFMFANNGSQDFGYIDWKDPNRVAEDGNARPTWTPELGIKGDVAAQRSITTKFNPSIHGVNWTADSNSMGVHVSKVFFDEYTVIGGGSGTTGEPECAIFIQEASGNLFWEQNTRNSQVYPQIPFTIPGMLHGDWDENIVGRDSDFFNSGVSYGGEEGGFAGQMVTEEIGVLSIIHTGGIFQWWCDAEVSMAFMGGTLRAEAQVFSDLIDNYMLDILSDDEDYAAVLQVAVKNEYTLPSLGQQVLQNQLIKRLKAEGIWDELDVFYMYANDGSAEFATLNWKDPLSNQNELTIAPTFISNKGFQGNASTMWMDSNFNPTNATKFDFDNYSLAMFLFDIGSAGYSIVDAVDSTVSTSAQIAMWRSGATDSLRCNVDYRATDYTIENPITLGHKHTDKLLGETNRFQFFNEGVVDSENDLGTAATIVPNRNFGILGGNFVEGVQFNSDAGIGYWAAGSSLRTNAQELSDLINSYMVNIIPLAASDINIVFDGNSLTEGSPSSPDQYFPSLVRDYLIGEANTVEYYSFGIYGQELRTMLTNASTKIDPLVDKAKTNILVVWEDSNDILRGNVTGQQNYDNMAAYIAGRRAAGYDKVILITSYYPRTPYGYGWDEFLPEQKAYFELVDATPLGDVRVDMRNEPNVGGPEGEPIDSTYFADFVHLKDLGYEKVADYVIAKGINKLF